MELEGSFNGKHPFESFHSVDGRNPAAVEVGSLPQDLQSFIHPRWCRNSSINSIIHAVSHHVGSTRHVFCFDRSNMVCQYRVA